jgi:acyl carrier protein
MNTVDVPGGSDASGGPAQTGGGEYENAVALGAARRLLATVAGREIAQIHPDDRLIEDLLMDSLDLVEMAMRIEQTWAIVLDFGCLRQVLTVSDVARLLACHRVV